jgi:hypothetical protein
VPQGLQPDGRKAHSMWRGSRSAWHPLPNHPPVEHPTEWDRNRTRQQRHFAGGDQPRWRRRTLGEVGCGAELQAGRSRRPKDHQGGPGEQEKGGNSCRDSHQKGPPQVAVSKAHHAMGGISELSASWISRLTRCKGHCSHAAPPPKLNAVRRASNPPRVSSRLSNRDSHRRLMPILGGVSTVPQGGP